jgi:cytochrome c-type biogenesis protein CcmH
VFVMKVLLSSAIVLAAAAVLAAGAAGAPRASLPDIEDEVMCPTCGLPLAHSFSPQAERQREFILTQIERGRTKEQIKQSLVAEFGPEVLAEPDPGESGFDIAAVLVPVGVVAGGLAAILVAVLRWRRRGGGDGPPGVELSAADSARLERDLSRYDP